MRKAIAAIGVSAGVAVAYGCLHVGNHGGGNLPASAVQQAAVTSANAYDIDVPAGYRVELVAQDLTYPTGVAFGDDDAIYVVEAGYANESYSTPRLLRVERDGSVRQLLAGDHAPWNGIAADRGALYIAEGGELDGGRIVRLDLARGEVVGQHVLASNLPSLGDHHTDGPVVGPDGYIYFGQGTATNSGIVGHDNVGFGWLPRHPEFHDTPCEDVELTGTNFDADGATTGAYQPFGTPTTRGQIVPGRLPCNGAVMRVPATGGPLELVAWGFRNPYGLAFTPDGQLFVTDNGYDVRGSRPVFGSADMMWRVERGKWYGWPDFSEGRPLTKGFYDEGGGKTRGFLLARHPGQPPDPIGYFPVHSSADGFDFSRSQDFGYTGWAFVAEFGDMAPTVGKVSGPVGFEVVRIDPATGDIADFARNKGDHTGPASLKHARGLERPIAARFDRSGRALYIVDFGVVRMTDQGAKPEPRTGKLWRIVREEQHVAP